MKYIIMAGGKGSRWNDYLGVPKHLVEIDNEPILARTVRLLKENGIKDIVINSENEKYNFAKLHKPIDNIYEIDRFYSCRDIWRNDTCFLYGDVYYTEQAIKTIVETSEGFFGRRLKNERKNYGEIFAIKIKDITKFKEAVLYIRQQVIDEKIKRGIGWEVYKYYNDLDLNISPIAFKKFLLNKEKNKNFIDINDETDDIDLPEDYHQLVKAINKRKVKLSIAIMAHPNRADYVDYLIDKLGDVPVIWDEINSVWDTSKRAWLSYDKEATHHMVIQDDAIIGKDVIKRLKKIIEKNPNAIITSCTVEYKLKEQDKQMYKNAYENGEETFESNASLSAIAIAMPIKIIRDMIKHGETLTTPHDDRKILYYARRRRIPILHTVPSLIDHRSAQESKSLLGHDVTIRGNRQAYIFEGE